MLIQVVCRASRLEMAAAEIAYTLEEEGKADSVFVKM
jgi:hypothetical protein